ncbi:MAG: fumarylacetoacetate hydrolase family protein [Candidatus Cloacimonetes bacterium]|nr:fumarylacetoacetate hydrolase family protein [Candidatus Cloacimonadota bacterium]
MNKIRVESVEVEPSKIICIGRNYVEHIRELGNEVSASMVVFIKPNSAISTQLISFRQEPIHYEAEICFVYSQGRFSAVGFGLDLTKRKLQNSLKAKGLPWERAKAFDGAAIFSEFKMIDKISENLTLELKINDKIVQTGELQQMIYKPKAILSELQTFINLNDGDVVMTGTPKGVGIIPKGNRFVGKIMDNTKTITVAEWKAI